MASITVRFYTLWRVFLGTEKDSLRASNVAEAMDQLEAQYGEQFKERLESRGIVTKQALRDISLILLNGRSIDKNNLYKVTLKSGDVLHLFPQVMGG